ncbi:hypothetical protein LDENG_00174970 [Lucifuga dentata]|nr:hypothetical protein LDENG_00174970 [Lucifuga dentata]
MPRVVAVRHAAAARISALLSSFPAHTTEANDHLTTSHPHLAFAAPCCKRFVPVASGSTQPILSASGLVDLNIASRVRSCVPFHLWLTASIPDFPWWCKARNLLSWCDSCGVILMIRWRSHSFAMLSAQILEQAASSAVEGLVWKMETVDE